MIEKLTPEQEDLMLVYNEKWCEIMYSTEPIDCEKAADAVKQAYRAIDEKEPEIIFCDSPYEGANIVSASERATNQLYEEFGVNLCKRFQEQLYDLTWRYFRKKISTQLFIQLGSSQVRSNISYFFTRQINEILIQNQEALGLEYNKYLHPIVCAKFCVISEFFFRY